MQAVWTTNVQNCLKACYFNEDDDSVCRSLLLIHFFKMYFHLQQRMLLKRETLNLEVAFYERTGDSRKCSIGCHHIFFFIYFFAAITCHDSTIAKAAVSTVVCTIPPSADILFCCQQVCNFFRWVFFPLMVKSTVNIQVHTTLLCAWSFMQTLLFSPHNAPNNLNLICKESCNSNVNK